LVNRKGRNPDSYRDTQVRKDFVFLIFPAETRNTMRIQLNILKKENHFTTI